MKNGKWLYFVALLLVAITVGSFFVHRSKEEKTFLKVGPYSVSLESFREAYSTDPSFPGTEKGVEGLKDYLHGFIDKRLALLQAEKEGLWEKDARLRKLLAHREEKELIKLFYRKNVAGKISVSEDELRDAYLKMNVTPRAKHLFSPTRKGAEKLSSMLNQGRDFDVLADSVFSGTDPEKGGADLGAIHWGDLEYPLEEALYSLKAGEFSPVVKSSWGYHILKLVGRDEKVILTEDGFKSNMNKIRRKIEIRKEKLLAKKKLKELLGPLNISIKKDAAKMIYQCARSEEDMRVIDSTRNKEVFNDYYLERLSWLLSGHLQDPFLESGALNWSIEDFIKVLEKYPEEERPGVSDFSRFIEDLGIIVRNEFIVKRAKRSGMAKQDEIGESLLDFKANLCYQFYIKNIFDSFSVPPEVKNYYLHRREKDLKLLVPSSIRKGMTSLERYKYYYSVLEARKRLRNESCVEIVYDTLWLKREAEEIDWDHPVRMVPFEFQY